MIGSLFVGWPLEAPDRTGRLAYAEDAQCLREALWNLLMTNPGERLMRPAFGAGLSQWIGHPNTQTTRQLIAAAIGAAIARWESRVAVSGIDVSTDPADPTRVVAPVFYTARGTPAAAPEVLSLSLQLGGA